MEKPITKMCENDGVKVGNAMGSAVPPKLHLRDIIVRRNNEFIEIEECPVIGSSATLTPIAPCAGSGDNKRGRSA